MTKVLNSRLGGNRHVVMLVNNPCVNDSRVIKSAEALVRGGWMVTVLCRHDKSLPLTEEINGVLYQRLEPLPRDVRSLARRLRVYFPGKRGELPSASLVGTKSMTRVWGIRIFSRLLDRLRPLSVSKVPRLPQAVRRITVRVWRKSLRVLSYPARMIYRFHETDEFSHVACSRAVQLRPDVVHCHDLATLPAGVSISKACGCKLVYDSHELEMHRNAKYGFATKLKRRRMEWFGIKCADAVITVSESIADHLRDDYRIRRPRVIMNAPEIDEQQRLPRTVRDDLRLSPDTPLAVYVGSVTVNRGLDYVVKALDQYAELHVATVGPRHLATQAELYELALKLGVDDRLHFVDPVPPSAVVGYISTADVSVLPIQNVCLSYYYCMPNKLLESVFAGIPVAVADLLEMRRFVETFRCGLVMDEKSPDAIANAIKSIVKDRRQFIVCDELRQQIRDTYSWMTQARTLRSLYDGLWAQQPIV